MNCCGFSWLTWTKISNGIESSIAMASFHNAKRTQFVRSYHYWSALRRTNWACRPSWSVSRRSCLSDQVNLRIETPFTTPTAMKQIENSILCSLCSPAFSWICPKPRTSNTMIAQIIRIVQMLCRNLALRLGPLPPFRSKQESSQRKLGHSCYCCRCL